MVKHTGEKFACITCDKKFTTAAYLQEHIRTHTGENLFSCTLCDRTFTRATYLEKHIRTHTGMFLSFEWCLFEFSFVLAPWLAISETMMQSDNSNT